MKETSNIDEMYDVLEEIDTKNFFDVESSLNVFLKKNSNADRKIWCEYTCLRFRIADGELKGDFTYKTDDGKIVESPNLTDFADEDLIYIQSRMESTENDLLKFRYAVILCNISPHQDKAKIIIDSSWNVICNLEREILQNNEMDGFFVTTIVNSYRYSFKFNYEKDRIRSKIIDLINDESFWNNNLYLIPCGLINHILSEKKNFKDVNNLNEICWNIYGNIESTHAPNAIQLLELGEKCDSQSHEYNWRLEMAKIYEKEMNESENPNVKAYHCLEASANYKKAGKISKSEELLEKYREFPPEFKYFAYHGEIENTPEIIEQLRDYAEDIVDNYDSKFILMYLMRDPRLIGHYESSLSFVETSKREYPLLYMFPINLRDENGFVIKKVDPDEDGDDHATMEYYNWSIRLTYLPFITQIINSACLAGKLSPKIILEFLRDETWLGWGNIQNVGKNDFLSMIVPIINNYFQEWELIYLYDISLPHFTLFIDSLVLKIEGILSMLYTIDNEINEVREDGSVQKKSLNTILEDEDFDLIPEDDLFFLRYLLIDKSGLNLRNKVAHSLMKKEDYNLGNANLLLLALLKLCSFQLSFNNES